MSILQEQIAKAQEAAAQNNQAVAVNPETQQVQQAYQAQNQVAQQQSHAVATQGTSLSVEDAVNSSMIVDHWLKVETGTVTVEDVTYADIPVVLSCAEGKDGGSITPFIGLNYGEDQDMKYSKTYSNGSGVVDEGETQGKSWAQHVSDIQKLYPNAKTFIGYQLVLEVAEDTTELKGSTVLPKGAVLGYSTSKTSSKEVAKFIKRLMREGKWGDADNKVLVDVSGKGMQATIKGRNVKWSVLTLDFKGDYVDASDLD